MKAIKICLKFTMDDGCPPPWTIHLEVYVQTITSNCLSFKKGGPAYSTKTVVKQRLYILFNYCVSTFVYTMVLHPHARTVTVTKSWLLSFENFELWVTCESRGDCLLIADCDLWLCDLLYDFLRMRRALKRKRTANSEQFVKGSFNS